MGGERPPDQVYSDFCVAFDRIVNAAVEIDTQARPRTSGSGSYRLYKSQEEPEPEPDSGNDSPPIIDLSPAAAAAGLSSKQVQEAQRQVIWISGGPGSGKSDKISRLLSDFPGWRLVNTGNMLWSKVLDGGGGLEPRLQHLMRRGDFAPGQIVVDSVTEIIEYDSDAKGFFVTGFPRDEAQASAFEEKASGLCKDSSSHDLILT